jgi:hypothetical protein
MLNQTFGEELQEEIVPFTQPFSVQFYVPGRPKAKARGTAMVSKSGKPYTMPDPKQGEKETYIRSCFLGAIHSRFLHLAQYLPVCSGWSWAEVYSLMPPPERWYPGLPHTGVPDYDNLSKLAIDALSGRAAGRPPMAFRDDSMMAGCYPDWKAYWNPELRNTEGYPESPGTLVVVHFELTPRNPKYQPAGTMVCPHCGDDKFTAQGGYKLHVARCGGKK